jgi:polygalacturonase
VFSHGMTRKNFLVAAFAAGVSSGLRLTQSSLAQSPKGPHSKLPATSLPGTHYDVRTFGAKGDGKSIDTPAVNRAIETAAVAGGGAVYFPAGTYSVTPFA